MEKTNQKTLEEIIRVDHAGERGAIKIYEGQLLALKTIKQDDSLKEEIFNLNIQDILHNIGLGDSITSQRTNGFLSALEKIKQNISNYE